MVGCAEQLISEYIDGDLAPAAAREVEHHLWACASCRATFVDFRALLALIRVVVPHGHCLRGTLGEVSMACDPFRYRRTERLVS
jgi:anti-sigma factor RsiW